MNRTVSWAKDQVFVHKNILYETKIKDPLERRKVKTMYLVYFSKIKFIKD